MDNEQLQIMPKISGYLEKKGRKKMMSCYKKYWFVLEGRLLLYYKSKDEYDAISPCKGSINLGPTSNIKPCSPHTGVFQIESKTTTITLRAETREDQHRWMQALISALNQRNEFKKLNHFRHSIGELSPTSKRPLLERQNTLPERFSTTPAETSEIIEKLQKMGAKSYGVGPTLQRSKTLLERQKQISFSDESIPSGSNFKTDLRVRKTESVIMEHEEFGECHLRRANSIESFDGSSEGIYERIPSSDSVFTRRELVYHDNQNETLMTENDVYWNRCNLQKLSTDTEYCYEAIDYNDNNAQPQVRKESEKSSRDENEYADLENQENGNQVEYADIVQYVDIDVVRKASLSSQESNEGKDKKKFTFGKKNKLQKQKSEDKKTKVRKSESFLQRVWHKKSKNKKNKRELSLSTNNIAAKIDLTENQAMKTLSELKDVLLKQSSAMKQLHGQKHVRQSITEDEEPEDSGMICNEMYVDTGSMVPTPVNDQDPNCPSLPPRNQPITSPGHKASKREPPVVPPKIKIKADSAKLDEILQDLNKQAESLENQKEEEDSQNKEGKVKELIKRFSIGKEEEEEEVELRQKTDWKLKPDISLADSNDLDKLLDELAKVTTAPIMTPGVTTSLINPEISDKEILKMVPRRRRRMSDPDYDIPRPHRSLINLPKKDANALEATRFFGPILKPSDYESHTSSRPPTPPADYHSNFTSITPDSLEVQDRKLDLSHDELRRISFDSHEYLSYNKSSHHNLAFLTDSNLYSDPRALLRTRNDFNMNPRSERFHHHDDNKFVDSLEP